MNDFEKEAELFRQHHEQLGYVKVIRCKDCKWWSDKKSYRDYSMCVDYERAMSESDYCSRAERKEE